jgi:hypothetical protein
MTEVGLFRGRKMEITVMELAELALRADGSC